MILKKLPCFHQHCIWKAFSFICILVNIVKINLYLSMYANIINNTNIHIFFGLAFTQ